jgi:prepilin-type N-terminal cleavage/methylation domain-containing protein
MKQGGFTLIELLISIVISGIIAAIALPVISNYIKAQQAIKTVKEMKYIAKAENLYYENNTAALQCTINGTAYNEIFHVYTSNFSDLTSNRILGDLSSDINYFGQAYNLRPYYEGQAQGVPADTDLTLNPNNYCVMEPGILVTTEIPIKYKGAVSLVPGTFALGANGNMEEVGYYSVPKEQNPEEDITLKYNW